MLHAQELYQQVNQLPPLEKLRLSLGWDLQPPTVIFERFTSYKT